MRRVILDSDAARRLLFDRDTHAYDPVAFDALRQAAADGRLELCATHTLRDELAGYRNSQNRARIEALLALAVDVPTGANVLGRSRLGHAALSAAQDADVVRRLREGRKDDKHANDMLITMTARMLRCPVVTADQRAVKAARKEGIAVMSPLELLIEMGYDPSELV